MDKNIFAKEEWKKYAKGNLVKVYIDFPRDKSLVPKKYADRNAQLQKKYGVGGYPSYILLSDDGEKILGRFGAGKSKTPATFSGEIKDRLRYSEKGLKEYTDKLKAEEKEKYLKIISEMKSHEAKVIKCQKKFQEARSSGNDELKEKVQKEYGELIKKMNEIKTKAVDFRAKKMGQEAHARFKELKALFEKKGKELKAWIATEPEQNEANYAIYGKFKEELSKIQGELLVY